MATSTAKPVEKPSNADSKAEKPEDAKESAAGYEEGQDDEFEDFPRHLQDWPDSETEAANQKNAGHLWEESWDDDDTSSDFSAQLREELKKVEASKKK